MLRLNVYFPKGLNLKEHDFIRKPKQNFLKIEVYLNQSEGVCVLRRALWPPLTFSVSEHLSVNICL